MAEKEIDKKFQHYMNLFKKDAELAKMLQLVSFENLFNPDFLKENSKFTSMDDMIWRSGFGIMNLLEVEYVNQDKWNQYIAANSDCTTWYEFGKLAMIAWMEARLAEKQN
ncbi:MAG TPA: hypothetical protein IAB06_05480 [Candidatus Avacidaminococcus intestinavium]|uniref:Phage protein n=1 Tax=Candidatus Avacidaminococcus intestinavium TaxID=2840684 RepID=A0A9D1MPX0_9FIRM|nr:hypothetical protein [Candidatus Avacidaminococcus intestinavium]